VNVKKARELTVRGQDQQICAGTGTLLTAGEGFSTYQWSPTEGLSSTTGRLITASPAKTTTYTVSGNLSSGCNASASVTVEVVEPQAISISPEIAQICEGESLQLNVSGGRNHIWDAAEGISTSVGPNIVVKPLETTSYRVTARDENGCEVKSARTVQVEKRDFLTLAASAASVCEGSEISLVADGADRYEWVPVPGLRTSNAARTYARPTASTRFQVIGYNEHGCSDTASVAVDVRTIEADFRISNAEIDLAEGLQLIQFEDQTEGATEWRWRFGTGSMSDLSNPTHVYTEVGEYKVQMLVSNGVCEAMVGKNVVVKNTSSLEDLLDLDAVSITESTKDGMVKLLIESPRKMYLRLRLLDASGKHLLAGSVRLREGIYEQQLNLSDFGKGIYVLQLTDGDVRENYRIAFE
ncbi:MAG: PKD domain-containing protein, partial [Bacteroidota bacterium]